MLFQGGIPTLPTSLALVESSQSALPICLSVGVSLPIQDSKQTDIQQERLKTAHTKAHCKMWAYNSKQLYLPGLMVQLPTFLVSARKAEELVVIDFGSRGCMVMPDCKGLTPLYCFSSLNPVVWRSSRRGEGDRSPQAKHVHGE